MIHHMAVACILICIVSTKGQLVEAWGEFLSRFQWEWFVTLTFREPVGSFRAHRLFERFVRELEKAAGIAIRFRADEIGSLGGRFHIHAVIGNVAHLRRMTWVDWWNRVAGYARILPFSAKRAAVFYCAKYITKQAGDWELSDNLSAFNQYQLVLMLEGLIKPKTAEVKAPEVAKKKSGRLASQRQLPISPASQPPQRSSDSSIGSVYRSEVTRGRGRYREFFARPDIESK
jgi:hypothetical protein